MNDAAQGVLVVFGIVATIWFYFFVPWSPKVKEPKPMKPQLPKARVITRHEDEP